MKLKKLLYLVGVVLVLTSCVNKPENKRAGEKNPGITKDSIVLGSSLALKGHAGYLGTQTLRGAMSYINHINDSGGIYGRKIRVIAYNDSYDPPQCLANTQKLIIDDNVFALFCYVGTPTTVKILPMVEEAEIPLVGMFTGANALRVPFNKYLINIRASYYQETEAAVQHLVQDLGLKRIAVFYQFDAYGFDGLTGSELAMKEFGITPVARGTYIRGTMGIEEGLSKIEESKAQAVVMIGTYDPCAEFIKQAGENGFHPVYYLVSFVGAEKLARLLPEYPGQVVLMSQVVPQPVDGNAAKTLGDASQYLELLHKYYPKDKPNFVGLEGFINAKVLVEGLKKAGPDLNRSTFIRAMESIEGYSLGPGLTINFGPKDHQGMDKVYFTRLVNGRFELIKNWQTIRDEITGTGKQDL